MEVRAATKTDTKRKKYETDEQLKNEELFKLKLEKWTGKRFFKLPSPPWRMDYMVGKYLEHSNRYNAVGFAELKIRNTYSDQYDTYMLSALKFENGVAWHGCVRECSFCLFVRFKDKDMFYKFKPTDRDSIHMEWGGRTFDTRDNFDVEPVVHIPMTLFKEVK